MSRSENEACGAEKQFELRPPGTPAEWDQYFDLRWRVLRAPWNQPPGSERDELEAESSHLALWNQVGAPVAVGRVHLNSPSEAQVRYMAVEPTATGSGFGSRILARLEAQACGLGATHVILNSRELARRFYERHGYAVTGPAATMFGEVVHVRMAKALAK